MIPIRFALARMVLRLCRYLPDQRPPDFRIGDPARPILWRWWLLPRNRLCNIYFHMMLADDDDRALHDHPYWSLSLNLSRNVGEVYQRDPPHGAQRMRWFGLGQWVWRSPTFAHRLVLRPASIGYTLFLTGPRIRDWGFWCATGWRHHDDFAAVADATSTIGRGCD